MSRLAKLERQVKPPPTPPAKPSTFNKLHTMESAVNDIYDGAHILIGGFGHCGVPQALVEGVAQLDRKNFTVIAGIGQIGYGAGTLLHKRQVKRMVSSYLGNDKDIIEQYFGGELEIEFIPQGTIAERLRAGGAGIPAFYCKTGYGTLTQEGGFATKLGPDGTPVQISKAKEIREFGGQMYVLEEALRGDFALIKGWKADKSGNVMFRGTARNFNFIMATAAKVVICEVEEVVEIGEMDPNSVHLPGVFVDRIVCPPPYEKKIENVRYRSKEDENGEKKVPDFSKMSAREKLARRVALEFKDGMYVNLGFGIPSLAANYLPKDIQIVLQGENGLLGVGPYPLKEDVDADFTSANKQTVAMLPHSSLFGSDVAFAMIRGGHMQMTVLGGLQASAQGDLANWIIPGKMLNGMGGAMDLVASGAKVCVLMEHTDKKGNPKILQNCTLPLTGKGAIDLLFTDKAGFRFDRSVGGTKMILFEVAPGVTIEEVKKTTGAKFIVAPEVKTMQYAGL